jgi:predicted DNA-binding protein
MVRVLITIYIMNREQKKVVTMRLSKEDDNLIKELARQDNLTKSAWIRRCLFKKINEYEQR